MCVGSPVGSRCGHRRRRGRCAGQEKVHVPTRNQPRFSDLSSGSNKDAHDAMRFHECFNVPFFCTETPEVKNHQLSLLSTYTIRLFLTHRTTITTFNVHKNVTYNITIYPHDAPRHVTCVYLQKEKENLKLNINSGHRINNKM